MVLLKDQLFADPRVVQAKKMLQEALEDHQKKITGVQPPQKEHTLSYQGLIDKLGQLRGGKLWYPYIGSGLGRGALVELCDGSIKYDMITGIGVHYLGHNPKELVSSQIDAALSNTIMQGNLQQNRETIDLLEILTTSSHMDHCFLTSSGAMACENALKMAFQKNSPANRILAFSRCFMGRSFITSQITDKAAYRQGLPLNILVDYVPFYDPSRPEESIQRSVSILKEYLARYPGQHALMSFELIQGEGGFYQGTREFFVALMEILKAHRITILVDEIQTFGRTPELFAFQYFGLDEYVDMVTIGKVSQVCATLYKKELAPKPGLLSQTFTSSTSAIVAATTLIKTLLNGHFFGQEGKIQKTHLLFQEKFKVLKVEFPDIFEGVFGIGSMVAFSVFGGDKDKTLKFLNVLFEEGVIAFVAGEHPARVRFLVPVAAITQYDIDEVVKIYRRALIRVQQEIQK